MDLWIWGLAVVAFGCGQPAPPPSGPADPVTSRTPTAMDSAVSPDAAIAVIDAAADAAVDAGIDAAPKRVLAPRPPVPGPVTKLALKKAAQIGGTTIELVGNSHKHVAIGGGPSPGTWSFTARRAGKTETFSLTSSDEGFEAELVVHGALIVFRHVSYGEFEAVLVAARAPKPLTQEACTDKVEQAAVTQGMPMTGHGGSESHGIVHVTATHWEGYCGRYTKRIWFTRG